MAVGLAMLAAAGLALALTPRQRLAEYGPKVDLETMVPAEFGPWRIDTTLVPLTVSPDVQAKLDKIYNQTLTRTYRRDSGERIMLSIAYGSNQGSDDFQVHRPEYCYVAQGFQLKAITEGVLTALGSSIPVRRLEAYKGPRNEPITYWITIGDRATLPGFGRKLAQLGYGLTGKVPDGLLVRVSSIQNDASGAYQLQDRFVADMLAVMEPQSRVKLVGAR
ncbi:MAG: EpsI family protein [Burkholderiales bacterium]|nr:EpsI family protein [Burkholderiales bacterium]